MTKEYIKLNPCPFCGKDPEYDPSLFMAYGNHAIGCYGEDFTVAFFGPTFEEAAEKWNNRQPAPAELITRITAIIEKLEEWRDFNQTRAGVNTSCRRSNHVGAVAALTKAIELLKNILV